MHPLGVLVAYLLFVMVGGALLAPCLYWAVQFAAEHLDAFQSLANQPFPRFFNRSMLALAAVGLWPLTKVLRGSFWERLGLVNPRHQLQRLAVGFVLGFCSLACVAFLATTAGVRVWQFDLTALDLMRTIVMAAASAIAVAVLEEALFRGGVFNVFRTTCTLQGAIVFSSVIYAAVHFLERPAEPHQISWTSGLQLLPKMAGGFADRPDLMPGFLALTVAGMILAVAYHRTGNLYCSIGLHAGWIFWLKFYRSVTVGHSRDGVWFWGTGKLIDGWLTVLVLGALFALLQLRPREDRSFLWSSILRLRGRSRIDKTPPAHAA